MIRASLRCCWILLLAAAAGCASGDEFGGGTAPGIPDGESTSTSGSKSDDPAMSTTSGTATSVPDTGSAEGPVTPPDLGSCDSDADCVLQGSLCFEPQGRCEDGACMFDAKIPGAPCDDGDPCTEDDMCDGLGGCFGNELECSAPNASGGTCVMGECSGFSCDPGWGDCDGDKGTGCETPLDTETDCGDCGVPCSAGPNAAADCSTGSCERSCTGPYENCDDDWSNGCEIPTGVPNQCDINGLNSTDGCWTAYCGSSNAMGAVNFGTWFCFECTTCHVPAGGQCQWCSHEVGRWYPAETCSCGAYEDLTCTP